MPATLTESNNFLWHCRVAAKLMDELPEHTVTKSHAVRAVRMATLCHAGKSGVRYVSSRAIAIKENKKKSWEKCGLIKEHIVPVSFIFEQVRRELNGNREHARTIPTLSQCAPSDLPSHVFAEFQQHPRAWQVAQVVREWTYLAWITRDDEKLFDDKNLHEGISVRKCMPRNWNPNQDRFSRYTNSNIMLSPI